MVAIWKMLAARTAEEFVIAAIGFLLTLAVICLAVGRVPISYNLRNLTVRWKTTALTALAFIMVISLMVVMLSFVNGMKRLTENSGQPGNVIVLADGAADEIMSSLAYGESGDIERQPGVLRDDNGEPICSREVYMVVNQPIPTPPGQPKRRRFLQVRGIEDPAMSGRVHGLELLPGSAWFSAAGVQDLPTGESAIQAVVGEGMADQYGKDRDAKPLRVNDVFELGGRQWICVGIIKAAGSTFGSEIWAKRGIVGPMFGKPNYSTIVLRTANAEEAAKLANFLKTDVTKSKVAARTETEYFSSLSQTNDQFTYAIVFVTVVMAIGGVFGVMNTMFAAIGQRIRDIGVLQILGFSRAQILVSFLLESLALALVGGLIGCFIGSFANGWTANSIVSSSQGGGKFVILQLHVTPLILAVGLLLALFMGLIGGILPAVTAMRQKPLECMR